MVSASLLLPRAATTLQGAFTTCHRAFGSPCARSLTVSLNIGLEQEQGACERRGIRFLSLQKRINPSNLLRTSFPRRMSAIRASGPEKGQGRAVWRWLPAEVGAHISNIETPALMVDLDVMERNMRRLAEVMAPYPNVQVRSHAKAHKVPEVALMQMELSGAVGMCCQKLTEAEAMVAGGVPDVLLSNEVVQPAKLERLAKLATRARVAVCIDDESNAYALSKVASAAGATLDVLVEVNVGQNRCGVDTPEAAVSLAKLAGSLPGLEFRGIQAYHGGIQHVRSYGERVSQSQNVAAKAKAVVDALGKEGLTCQVVTGGGTGTFLLEAASGVYTEVQPGSYIFGDADYARNLDESGKPGTDWKHSLFVLATVMSRNVPAKRAVIDAGLKAASLDSGPPLVAGDLGQYLQFSNGGDEHGILGLREGGLGDEEIVDVLPEVGSQVRLVPGHCDPTVNMYDFLIGVRNDVVETIWTISGRGPGL